MNQDVFARAGVGPSAYNGDNVAKVALQSALGKTCPSFEPVNLYSASADRKAMIYQSPAEPGVRGRYYHIKCITRAASAFNRVFELSYNAYVIWNSREDIHAPCFLENSVCCLDVAPSNLLTYARAKGICREGTRLPEWATQPSLCAEELAILWRAGLLPHTDSNMYRIVCVMRPAIQLVVFDLRQTHKRRPGLQTFPGNHAKVSRRKGRMYE